MSSKMVVKALYSAIAKSDWRKRSFRDNFWYKTRL